MALPLLEGRGEETCRVDLSVSYQCRGLLLWIWDNRELVCVGIGEGRRGVDSLETGADPSRYKPAGRASPPCPASNLRPCPRGPRLLTSSDQSGP